MSDFRQEFLKLAFDTGVLRFGEFTLKSGRVSPYFFNAGLFNTGRALAQLARHYASAIVDDGLEFDMLFGPAYKGIPLVAAVSMSLAEEHGRDLPWCFNRKEAKDHGEGGSLVGAPLQGRVLIVDDVITAGTAVRESLDLIRAAGAEPVGVSIALDRQERGQDSRSAIQSLEQDENLHAVPIARLDDLLVFLEDQPDQAEALESVKAYRDKYGV